MKTEKVFLNNNQLVSRLGTSHALLAAKLATKQIEPDAVDALGRNLFSESRIEELRNVIRGVNINAPTVVA